MSANIVSTTTYCVALHPFISAKSDELNLNPGDVLKVTRKADDGWWFGYKTQPSEDTKGWFPSNFTLEPFDMDLSAQGPLRYAKVAFEYKKVEEDELELHINDHIAVVNTAEDEGWLRGVLNGKFGVFPANFVVMISKAEYDKTLKLPKTNSSNSNSTSSKSFPDRRSSLAIFGNHPVEVSKKSSDVGLGVKLTKKPISTAVVSYPYVAQQTDELNLIKGAKISVLKKDDEGWWTGMDESGKTGVFPFNFVKEVNPEQEESDSKPVRTSVEKPTLNTSDLQPPKEPRSPVKPNIPKPVMDTTVPPVAGLARAPSGSHAKNKEPEIQAKPTINLKPILSKPPSSSNFQPNNAANNPPPVLPKPKVEAPPLSKKPALNISKPVIGARTAASENSSENKPADNTSKPAEKEVSETISAVSSVQLGVKAIFKRLGGNTESPPKEQKESKDEPKAEPPKLIHVTKNRPTMAKKRPPSKIAFSSPSKEASPIQNSILEESLNDQLSPQSDYSEYETDKYLISTSELSPQSVNSGTANDTHLLGPVLLPACPPKDLSTTELYKLFYEELVRMRDEFNSKLQNERKSMLSLEKEVVEMKKIISGSKQ